MMHHGKSTSRHGLSSTGYIYPVMESDIGLLVNLLFKVFLVEDRVLYIYTEQSIVVLHIIKH